MLGELKGFIEKAKSDEPIEDSDLQTLHALMIADHVVSREEADALFLIRVGRPELEDSETFQTLFVNALTSFLLYTGETPGSVDNIEWIWLSDRIGLDGEYTPLEKALVKNLALRAENLPANFPADAAGL